MFKRITAAFFAAALMLVIPLGAFAEDMTSAESMTSSEAAPSDVEYRETEIPVPHHMVVMGDSIATGFGLEGYNGGKEKVRSYANILKDRYSPKLPSDCPYVLENFAVDGYTSEDLLKLLKDGKCDKALSEADCIVVSIGGNDLLGALWYILEKQGIGKSGDIGAVDIVKILTSLGDLEDKLDENLEAFDKNLPDIASCIVSKTGAELIIQTLYNPLENFSLVPGIKGVAKKKIDRLNEIIKMHAGDPQGQYTVCDTAPGFTDKAEQLTNISKIDIHPNAEGHKVISEILDKVILTKKYSYMKEFIIEPEPEPGPEPEPEPVSEPADANDSERVTTLQGNSTVMIAVICSVCAMSAGAGAMYLILRKRLK